jgi:D,D-heptose 1,7-bisphosphate phosphatase
MNKILDLVILAGGQGKRLGSITKKTPKPLLKINGIPFLRHLINYYSRYSFKNIYILAGYKGIQIKDLFHNKKINLIPIKCFIEENKKDTGGALHILKNKIKNNFILINGDSFLEINLEKISKIKLKKSIGLMVLIKNNIYKENKKLSNLKIDKNKFIVNNVKSKLMNSGIYLFKKNILNHIKNKRQSLEEEILPKLIEQKKIKGMLSFNYFIDIGSRKNLKLAKKQFNTKFYKPAIFLDRDGVINKDLDHVFKIKDFKYTKNIFTALKMLSNYFIFIITNQAGIAKGLYSENDFFKLHTKIKGNLIKKNIYINEVKFCPHHPNGVIKKYTKNCLCRKPGTLMVNEIFNSWNINLKKSLMIGDKISDMLCAKNSNLKFQFVQKNIETQIKNFIKL